MKAFQIEDDARVEIADLMRRSGCHDPVATMRDSAVMELPKRLKSAVVSGTVTDAEQGEILNRAEQLMEEGSANVLDVAVFERAEYRVEDLFEVNGVAIGMTGQMLEALSDYSLRYSNGRYRLEAPGEVAFSLRSVKALAKWFA